MNSFCSEPDCFIDHDQRFKTLIQLFFQEFLLLFFKSWAERLDAAAVEWLDKEVFPDPPEGQRQILDLVGKLPTRRGVQAYLPMDEEAKRQFERLLTSEHYHGVQAMNTTWYEKGLE